MMLFVLWVVIVFNLIGGWMVDCWGCVWLLIVVKLLLVIGVLLVVFVFDFNMIFVGCFFVGMVYGIDFVIVMVMFVEFMLGYLKS